MRLCGGMAMRVCGGMCKCEEHWVCALQMSARVGHGAWETRHVCVCASGERWPDARTVSSSLSTSSNVDMTSIICTTEAASRAWESSAAIS